MWSLPSLCQVCGRWPASPICGGCLKRFAPVRPRCPRCAGESPDGRTCGECMVRQEPSVIGRCVTVADYAYPWDRLIARFKFRNEPGWAGPLADPMWERARSAALVSRESVWVPVPVSPQRLMERGYNQAWELCRILGRLSCLTALPEALVRTGVAPDQHRLKHSQRLTNLRGAFAVHPDHVAHLRGAAVVLIDDVRTTGATLENAALALRQAGCARVDALVFARTSFDLHQTPRT